MNMADMLEKLAHGAESEEGLTTINKRKEIDQLRRK